MKEDFFKFPSTPHLATLPGVDVREDKVLSDAEQEAFLHHNLIVEEKLDGANLGISFDSGGNLRSQNRGAYLNLPESGQWKKLDKWLSAKTEALFDTLSDRFILFGEWCYAMHSVFYDHLPDWFLGFDLYDKHVERFLCVERRDDLLKKTGIIQVPIIAHRRFELSELENLLSKSVFSKQPAEGLYLRIDHGDWLIGRAKLVRPAFVQSIDQHWSRSEVKPNRLDTAHVEQ